MAKPERNPDNLSVHKSLANQLRDMGEKINADRVAHRVLDGVEEIPEYQSVFAS